MLVLPTYLLGVSKHVGRQNRPQYTYSRDSYKGPLIVEHPHRCIRTWTSKSAQKNGPISQNRPSSWAFWRSRYEICITYIYINLCIIFLCTFFTVYRYMLYPCAHLWSLLYICIHTHVYIHIYTHTCTWPRYVMSTNVGT